MQDKRSTLHDIAAGVIVAAALALPFVPLPGDGAARMKVHFRTADTGKPQSFSTETSQSVCNIMAATLSYEDPKDGAFTHVKCSE
jgi:hypothetical protein